MFEGFGIGEILIVIGVVLAVFGPKIYELIKNKVTRLRQGYGGQEGQGSGDKDRGPKGV